MKVINSQNHLRCIEQDDIFIESPLILINFVELTTSNERHHEVKSKLILKHVFHWHQEWMITFKHDLLF